MRVFGRAVPLYECGNSGKLTTIPIAFFIQSIMDAHMDTIILLRSCADADVMFIPVRQQDQTTMI